MSKPSPTFWRYWWPAIAWAVVVTGFSTEYFSGAHTSRFILPALHWLFPHASSATIAMLNSAIRRAAHIVEYFVLSMLVFRGIRGPGRGWRLAWSGISVALVVGYSVLDEVHQAFVPARTASIRDVVIDTIGATAAQVMLWAFLRGKSSED